MSGGPTVSVSSLHWASRQAVGRSGGCGGQGAAGCGCTVWERSPNKRCPHCGGNCCNCCRCLCSCSRVLYLDSLSLSLKTVCMTSLVFMAVTIVGGCPLLFLSVVVEAGFIVLIVATADEVASDVVSGAEVVAGVEVVGLKFFIIRNSILNQNK